MCVRMWKEGLVAWTDGAAAKNMERTTPAHAFCPG